MRKGLVIVIVVAVVLPLLSNLVQKPQDTRNLAVEVKGDCNVAGNNCCGPDSKGGYYCTGSLTCEGGKCIEFELVECERCSTSKGCQRAVYSAINDCKNTDGTWKSPAPGTTPIYKDDCSCGTVASGDNTPCEPHCLGYGTCKTKGADCCTDDRSRKAYCENGLACDSAVGTGSTSPTFNKCVEPSKFCPLGAGIMECEKGQPCKTSADCKEGLACSYEGDKPAKVCGEIVPCERCSSNYGCAWASYYAVDSCTRADGKPTNPIKDLPDKPISYITDCSCPKRSEDDLDPIKFPGDNKRCEEGKCTSWYFCGPEGLVDGKCLVDSTSTTKEACELKSGGRTCRQGTKGSEDCITACKGAVEYFTCAESGVFKECMNAHKWESKEDCTDKTMKCETAAECKATCCGNLDQTCCKGTTGGICNTTDLTCKDNICKKTEVPPKNTCTDAVNTTEVKINDSGCDTTKSVAKCIDDGKGGAKWGGSEPCENGCGKDGKCIECGEKDQACCTTGDKCKTDKFDLKCVGNKCLVLSNCKYNKAIVDYKDSWPNAVGGDFNCDGLVNIADYSVWRKESQDKLTWDGSGNWWSDAAGINDKGEDGYVGYPNGVVDGADYSVWRHYFLDDVELKYE